MHLRVALVVASVLAGTAAHAQTAKDEFITTMRQSVEQAKARGEPKDRCSLGVQMGDNGRVLMVFGNSPLQPGDVVKTLNGESLRGRSASSLSALLRGIAPTAMVPATLDKAGETRMLNLQCSNAMAYNGPLVAAQDAAGRKDFRACMTHMASISPAVLRQWHFQYTAVNCATHAKAIDKTDEVNRVYGWISGLLAEAAYIAEERELAERAVQVASAYFNVNGRPDLHAKLETTLASMYATAGIEKPAGPDWALFRQAGEKAVRARLVDPSSAQFEWPHGFLYGTWKPFLSKRVEGYWTCGQINARNRMGGYVGATYFVVVMDKSANVTFVDMGTGKDFDIVDTQCAKSVALLPPPPVQLTASGPATPAVSIADELEKLAALKDKGILTQAEFDAQKAVLLRKSH